MLFKAELHERIRSGGIRCTVRIWHRPRARLGGRYSLPGGVVVVDEIRETDLDSITPALARRCGFASLADLLKTAQHGTGERVFVIDFHFEAAAAASKPVNEPCAAEELASLVTRLDAMDRRSRIGAWTLATLRAIEARPGVLAAKLARSLGRPRDELKRDVRKLKKLGLTASSEIGYRLTPKGEALLASLSVGR